MKRSTIYWLAGIILVILIGLYLSGTFRSGTGETPGQPSPHAIDQSQ